MSLVVPVSHHDHISGALDAPIVLVEYGDYECGFCGEAYPVIKAVAERLGDQLCFVFRNFPLAEAHPHAERAAEIAEAAGVIGQFWPMHDLLFENQAALDDESLFQYGMAIGLDQASIMAALRGHFAERIRRDFVGGVRSGVNGTPCLFIGGIRYDGSRDADELYDALLTSRS